MTSRASLSMADSARPSAKGKSSRAATMPRRPRCSATAFSISLRAQRIDRSAASRVASARGRRNCRATSTAVHAGAVARRPDTRWSRAPTRWWTIRPTVGRILTPGSSIWIATVFSVSNPYNAAAVPRHATACPPHEHIESRQAAQQVRLLCRVDPVPNANEAAVFHLDVELLAGHDREQLRGGGEPAGLLENC